MVKNDRLMDVIRSDEENHLIWKDDLIVSKWLMTQSAKTKCQTTLFV